MQIQQLILQYHQVEENTILLERLKKAAGYFIDKTENIILKTLNNNKLETDNKTIRKSVNEILKNLNEETNVKLSCLRNCIQGFNVSSFLEARAKELIESQAVKPVIKEKVESLAENIPHPLLYTLLKTWRNVKANELKVPVFIVINLSVLIQISGTLPRSIDQLKQIKGLGVNRLRKYGNELLDIILRYCHENNIAELNVTELANDNGSFEQNDLTEHAQKSNTRQVSFELFSTGKKVAEIAEIRKMTLSTIESHLIEYLDDGISIEQLVSSEKIVLITDYFKNNEDRHLKPAKDVLGENISYSEIRYVLKHILQKGLIKA